MRSWIQRPAHNALVLSCYSCALSVLGILAAFSFIVPGAAPVFAQAAPSTQATPGSPAAPAPGATPNTRAIQNTGAATQDPASSTALPESAIQRIRDRGDILVAGVQYDLPPLSFVNDEGEIVGFEVDLVRALADVWGVDVEFVPVTPQDRVQRVRAGQVDLILLSRYAAPRPGDPLAEEEGLGPIDISVPYFSDRLRILTRAAAGYEYIDDLSGTTVATIVGVTTSQFADTIRTERISLDTQSFQEYAPALAALSARQVDALVAPGTFLEWAAQQNPQYSLLEQPLTREPMVMGFAAGDPYFRNLIDYTLQQLQEEGRYETLYAIWFPHIEPLAIPVLPGNWPFSFADSPVITLPDAPSRVQQFKEREALLVGIPYDLPPFGYITNSGAVTGFDAALASEFAERWLGDGGAVDLVPVTTQTRAPLLAAGGVDLVIAQMVQTWESEELVDFSQAYFVDQLSLLVRSGDDLTSLSDLNGKVVAVVNDESVLELLRTRISERAIDVEILPFQEHASMVQALQAEQIDAVMLLGIAAFRLAQDEPELQVLDIPNSAESYNIGVPEGDTELLALVDQTLQAMRRDGTYDALYRDWFASEEPLSLPTDADIRAGHAITRSLPITAPAFATTGALTETAEITTDVPITSLFISADSTRTVSGTVSNTVSSPVSGTDLLRDAAHQDLDTITHTVMEEESLIDLANRYYGNPDLWRLIYEVNRTEIGSDPNILLQGTILLIPEAP